MAPAALSHPTRPPLADIARGSLRARTYAYMYMIHVRCCTLVYHVITRVTCACACSLPAIMSAMPACSLRARAYASVCACVCSLHARMRVYLHVYVRVHIHGHHAGVHAHVHVHALYLPTAITHTNRAHTVRTHAAPTCLHVPVPMPMHEVLRDHFFSEHGRCSHALRGGQACPPVQGGALRGASPPGSRPREL